MSTALLTVFAASLLATFVMVVYGLRVLLFRWELPRGVVLDDRGGLPPEPTPEAPPPQVRLPHLYAAPPMTWTPPPSPAWRMPPLQAAGSQPVYQPAQPGTIASSQAPLPASRSARGSIPPDFIETTEVGPPPVHSVERQPYNARSGRFNRS